MVMNWQIVLLVVILVWYIYPSEVRENFPSSVYDLVWVEHAHRQPFEETLKWNLYQKNPPEIKMVQAGQTMSYSQQCAQKQLQEASQQQGYAQQFCHGNKANTADEMKQCMAKGGALIPCLCKDYYQCLLNGGDKVKCEQKNSYRGCMAEPNAKVVNC